MRIASLALLALLCACDDGAPEAAQSTPPDAGQADADQAGQVRAEAKAGHQRDGQMSGTLVQH
jgi:hypothetical protein